MSSKEGVNLVPNVADAVHEKNGRHPTSEAWKENPDGPPCAPPGELSAFEARMVALVESTMKANLPSRAIEDTADVKDVAKHRRWIGYGLAAFTVGAVTCTAYRSHDIIATIPAPGVGQPPTFASATVIAHAVVTAAFISFCVVLMRIAERLFMPYWWANKTKNIGLLLGHRGMSEKRYLEILKEILATVRGTKE